MIKYTKIKHVNGTITCDKCKQVITSCKYGSISSGNNKPFLSMTVEFKSFIDEEINSETVSVFHYCSGECLTAELVRYLDTYGYLLNGSTRELKEGFMKIKNIEMVYPEILHNRNEDGELIESRLSIIKYDRFK